MWVADFPRAPARLCAQRMIAPLRLRSRVPRPHRPQLDRAPPRRRPRSIALCPVGSLPLDRAPPPHLRSSSSPLPRSIALCPIGVRSIALVFLASAQVLLVVSRPDDASDGAPWPCSCSTASPSRSPARCGRARATEVGPHPQPARAYCEGAVVACPGSASAVPVGTLCMPAAFCISRVSSRVGYICVRSNDARYAPDFHYSGFTTGIHCHYRVSLQRNHYSATTDPVVAL